MVKNSLILLLLLFFIGCQKHLVNESPEPLRKKGISLGASKNNVILEIGKAKMEFNYKSNNRTVSILDYDSMLIDYRPGYERDDVGILKPASGINIQPKLRKDYRLVFINNILYSIEDFVENKYYVLPEYRINQDEKTILEQIKK